jgi:putative ABC transport system permease protein
MRTAFTISGISIGIAAIISICGLSIGLEETWKTSMESRNIDIVVNKKGGNPITDRINESEKKALLGVSGIKHSSASLIQMLSIEETPMMVVSGREWGPYGWEHLDVIKGRVPANADEKSVLLGVRAAETLKKNIGDSVQIELLSYTVSGIVDSDSMIENNSIILALPLLQEATGDIGRISVINIAVDTPQNEALITKVCDSINSLDSNITALPSEESISSSRNFKISRVASIATSFLAVLIGAVGVMNTMTMSVFERQSEIGLFSALGWSKMRIMRMIVIESILLSLAGYIGGLIMGGGGLILLKDSPLLKGLITPYLGPELLLSTLFISVIIGFFSGLYPAWISTSAPLSQTFRKIY